MKNIFNYLDNFYIQGATSGVWFVQKHYEYFNKPDSDISDKIGYCKLEKNNDEYILAYENWKKELNKKIKI